MKIHPYIGLKDIILFSTLILNEYMRYKFEFNQKRNPNIEFINQKV